jgi:hypothetical protein
MVVHDVISLHAGFHSIVEPSIYFFHVMIKILMKQTPLSADLKRSLIFDYMLVHMLAKYRPPTCRGYPSNA